MAKGIGELIRGKLDDLVCVDPNEDGKCWGRFMRKPLRRGMKIQLEDGEHYWTTFLYECPPCFCFVCRLVGQLQKRLYSSLSKFQRAIWSLATY